MEAWPGSYSRIRDIFVDGALSRDLLLPKLVSREIDVKRVSLRLEVCDWEGLPSTNEDTNKERACPADRAQ